MSSLTLVRHGQASFFAADYDQLSEDGHEQARLLGRHWANLKLVIDEVFAGPRLRQQQTAELAGMSYAESGLVWPKTTILEDLDEYDLHGLQNHLAPRLLEGHPEFASLSQSYRASETDLERMRHFQRMFEILLYRWQAADMPDVVVESWLDFQQRVQRVLQRVQEQTARNRRVVMFTSGGFIGTAVQSVMKSSDASALELNWRVRNCSLTEFVFNQSRFTLDNFNMVPHLPNPSLWTYR